jgi:hypothetical protein
MHCQNIVDGDVSKKNFLKIFLVNFTNRYILNPVLTILLWLQFLTYRPKIWYEYSEPHK